MLGDIRNRNILSAFTWPQRSHIQERTAQPAVPRCDCGTSRVLRVGLAFCCCLLHRLGFSGPAQDPIAKPSQAVKDHQRHSHPPWLMNPILQHALTGPRSRNMIPAVLRKRRLPALKPACMARLVLLLWAARQQAGLGQERLQMIMKDFFQLKCRKSQSQLESPWKKLIVRSFVSFGCIQEIEDSICFLRSLSLSRHFSGDLLGSAHLPAASLTLQMPLSSSQDSLITVTFLR